jgi:hypothetical protein
MDIKKIDNINIPNGGKIDIFSNIVDGKGRRNTKDFLKSFSKEFVKENINFNHYFYDLAYAYREKQIHSVTIPAIHKVANNIFTEIPVYRDNSSNLGWIDYGVYYGNSLLLIELKHSYFGLQSNKLRNSSMKEWLTSLEQINSLSNTEHLKIKQKDNIVKIALNIITVYSSTIDYTSNPTDMNDIKEAIAEQVQSDDLFIASWKIDESLVFPIEYANNKKEIYPYLFIVAKIL